MGVRGAKVIGVTENPTRVEILDRFGEILSQVVPEKTFHRGTSPCTLTSQSVMFH
jgi:hypothetical protein